MQLELIMQTSQAYHLRHHIYEDVESAKHWISDKERHHRGKLSLVQVLLKEIRDNIISN